MTPEQIGLVRKSFDAIWPVRRQLACRFHSRFFKLPPEARRLFSGDMERQQLKLMDILAALVGTLDESELFQSLIQHTGRQHARFGVESSHYSAFREALMWALGEQFGVAFTPELRQAWFLLYDVVQGEMMRAEGAN
jgi:hemoglobin-like flavoprotein